MAIAVTVDSRPSVFGNMIVVSGAFTISGGTDTGVIDVSEFMSSIKGVTVTSTDATSVYAHLTGPDDTTFNVKQAANNKSGHFMAIGNR